MTLDPKYYFQISPSSGVPIYRQIMDQVKVHVAAGRLKDLRGRPGYDKFLHG